MEYGKGGTMNYKWIGAVLIVTGCAGFGFAQASAYRKEESVLRQLLSALDFMECELQYRLTPLPDLCRQVGKETTGCIRAVFNSLAQEMDRQIAPDVSSCMHASLAIVKGVPERTKRILRDLGNSMGRFDLNGQLKGLEQIRSVCRQQVEALSSHRDERIRGYQTLGLCAGAALAILMI